MHVCNGNNGGHVYIVAHLAQAAGIKVKVLPLAEPFHLRGDGATGGKVALSREVQHYIRFINSSTAPALSIDMPSGVEADTGHIESEAVQAHMTVCLVGFKLGLFTGRGPDVAGNVVLEDLQIPPLINSFPWGSLLSWPGLCSLFPHRRVGAHKGEAGENY